MIDKETLTKARLHFYRDHWPIGTIANQLGIHPDAVRRAIKSSEQKKKPTRKSPLEPYLELISKTLEEYPTLPTTRLLDMIKERGYTGSVYPLRRHRKKIAPRVPKAFLDLKFLPGEQAQVDWGSFGSIDYDGKRRGLYALVIVLSYSRRIYGRFFHDMKAARVLEGQRLAFEYFGGVPRTMLFDNMKTAVLENVSGAVRFNHGLLDFASTYRFEPRACNPRSGWEKGRTERAIRYLRGSFFTGREFKSLGDLNHQLMHWLENISEQREWPDDRTLTVRQAFDNEKPALLELPGDPCDPYEQKMVRVDKKAMITFDCNRYPIDPEWTGQQLMVRATHEDVKIFHGQHQLAAYQRIWGKGQTAYAKDHQEKIAKARGIKQHRAGRHVLAKKLPSLGQLLLEKWAEAGSNLQTSAREVIGLIDSYGRDEVEAAAKLAIENGTPSPCSMEHILLKEHGPRAFVAELSLPKNLQDLEIQHPQTAIYDRLYEKREDT